jgi:hypothetical protein
VPQDHFERTGAVTAAIARLVPKCINTIVELANGPLILMACPATARCPCCADIRGPQRPPARPRAQERADLIAKMPDLERAQERLAKAVTKALVLDDEVLMAEVQSQYDAAKKAVAVARERVAELEGTERDLREQREAIESAGEQMASWVELLGRAEVEPEHLAAARKFLNAVLVGPLVVKPVDFGWVFEGRSRLDGRVAGVLVPKVGAITIGVNSKTGSSKISVSTHVDCRCDACVRPISGGSDAPITTGGVVGSLRGPEMAPHTPHAPRPGGSRGASRAL